MLCVTAVDCAHDSAAPWFTEVGVTSRDQPQQDWQRSRHVHHDNHVPASRPSDGPYKNLICSQDDEVHFRHSDGPSQNCSQGGSQHHSIHVWNDCASYGVAPPKDQQLYICRGRRQCDEEVRMEDEYMSDHQVVSQSRQQTSLEHNMDCIPHHPSICLSDEHQPFTYTAMRQSHQQVRVEQDNGQQRSMYLAVPRTRQQFSQRASSDQAAVQSDNEVLVERNYRPDYRVDHQSQQHVPAVVQHYLPVHHLPQTGVVYAAASQTDAGEGREKQHVVTDSRYQLTASGVPCPASVCFSSQEGREKQHVVTDSRYQLTASGVPCPASVCLSSQVRLLIIVVHT